MEVHSPDTGSLERRMELPQNHVGVVERPAFSVLEDGIVVPVSVKCGFVL